LGLPATPLAINISHNNVLPERGVLQMM